MKNKEMEEILNKIKNAIKKHKEEDLQDDMLVILELDVIQWNLLLSHIEQLEKEKNENLTKVIEDFKNKVLEKSKWLKMVYQDEDGMKHIYDDKNWVIEKINKILGVDK